MKLQNTKKDVKKFTYRILAFFLFAPLFINLVGNLVAISGQYTFYYLGYNSVAIASRFIENTIYNISARVLLLGLTSLFTSGMMYFIYYHAKRGSKFMVALSITLYILDYLLIYSDLYMEGAFGTNVSSMLHLSILIMFAVTLILHLLVNPIKRGHYDYA